MGTTGPAVLARTDRSLASLECVAAIGVECHEYVRGAWRQGQIFLGEYVSPEELAAALVAETGAPALAMFVSDSDFAQVWCDSPGGARHEFVLDVEAMLGMYTPWDPPPPPQPTVAETVAALLAWAAEAGLDASADRIAAALPERPGPFGEGIAGLLGALGVPEIVERGPAGGMASETGG